MASADIVAHLLRVELFHGLKPLQITEIAGRLERVTYRAGDVIAAIGEHADAALLLVAGRAETRGIDEDESELIEIGSLIAEMAMFIEYEFGTKIIATEAVKCLRLSREAMHELMLDDPSLAELLTRKITQRLAALADQLRDIDETLDAALPQMPASATANVPSTALLLPMH